MSVMLKPYPEYKDSGVPWLGKIPRHWEVRRFKYLLHEVNTRSADGQEQLLSVSQYTGVTPRRSRNGDDEPDTRAASLVGYKRVSPNDLVVNIMLAWNGSLGVARSAGIVSPSYCVYRFHDHVEPWYYHNLLRLPLYRGRIKVDSTGVVESRLRLYSDDLFRIEALVPQKEEQAVIARFVDTFGRRVDHLIRTKRRLIELLNEQKQVTIYNAVTGKWEVKRVKGENGEIASQFTPRPAHFMKPSGIGWLGDVPEYWSVAALRMHYSVELGKMLDAKQITGQYLVPYLRNVDVQWDQINTDDLPTMDIKPHEYARYTLQPGDMLVCEGGEVGRSAFWHGQLLLCGFQKALHRLRPLHPERDAPRFLFYLMYMAAKRGVFMADGNENTIAHLTGEKLRAYRFVFPPEEEQETIVRSLDEATADISNAIDRTTCEIDLLREYRTRLIADVVTGKLDVRSVKFEGGREKEEEGTTWFEDETVEDLDEGAEERGDDE